MTCSDLEQIIGELPHCSSCHEDWEEYNYEMTFINMPDGREFHVCCAAKREALEIINAGESATP